LAQFLNGSCGPVHGQDIRTALEQFSANSDAKTTHSNNGEAEAIAAL
jgi:hypothetical protein